MPTPLAIPTRLSSDAFPFPSPEDATARLLAEDSGGAEGEDEDGADESAWAGLSPLDETLEKIGMGRYQKSLL